MSLRIRRVVGQCAQGESILIAVARFADQVENKVAAAHIVHQSAEELAPKRIEAHVLNNAPAISVRMGPDQLVWRRTWKAPENQRLQTVVPRRVDNSLVRKN